MTQAYLTDALVRAATCPEGKSQDIICDSPIGANGKVRSGSISGLGLRVTARGAKSFVHAYRYNGKAKRQVVGTPTNLNVASARLLVQQRNSQIERGIDPSSQQSIDFRKKHGDTVGDIIEAYVAEKLSRTSKKNRDDFSSLVAPWTKEALIEPKKSNKGVERITFGGAMRDELAECIKPTQVSRYIKLIESDSVANATLKHIKALFNWAIRMQLLDMRNPCDPLLPRKIIKKRRDYTPEQVKIIAKHVFDPPICQAINIETLSGREKRFAALRAGNAAREHDQLVELCNYMGILFLTMARPIEVKTAKFEHFELDRLIWQKHNTKGIKLSQAAYEYAFRSVPIHSKVAEIVLQQKARWPESELLFPNHLDQTKPRDNFKRSIQGFKKLKGVPEHFQLYDLKRMAISMMMVGQGIRREDVSHYVDHKGNLETTLIYDLGFVDPLRPVTEKLGEALGLS